MTAPLRLEGAGVQRDNRWILRGADLEVRPGTMTCLLGPNGAGKSTLMRVATGIWAPDEGRALLDGVDVRALPRRQIARSVAFVPQRARIAFDFTVREVVAMGRYPHEGRLSRQRTEDHPAIGHAMERVDVVNLADRFVTTLSGGEAQRVMLARCLATEARIVLLDEPTAALDIEHALEVMALCRSLAVDGMAVVAAIHDLNAALRYATDIVVLDGGMVTAQGPPETVLAPALIRRVFGVEAEPLTSRDGSSTFLFREPR